MEKAGKLKALLAHYEDILASIPEGDKFCDFQKAVEIIHHKQAKMPVYLWDCNTLIFLNSTVKPYWMFCPQGETVADLAKAIKYRVDVLKDFIKFFAPNDTTSITQ
jgi:hypothetical protein